MIFAAILSLLGMRLSEENNRHIKVGGMQYKKSWDRLHNKMYVAVLGISHMSARKYLG